MEQWAWEKLPLAGSERDKDMKRLTETFLLEHRPLWEMWVCKMLLSWTTSRRWTRLVLKTFLRTVHHEKWKLDSHGLPVQLLSTKFPTWPAELGHHEKLEMRRPCQQALRDTIESAKSEFLTQHAEVSAFAKLSSEQILEQLNMATVLNHLWSLCKSWGLVQAGKKEEVIDRIIAYIIEQQGTAAPTTKIKKEVEIKKMETAPTIVGPAIAAHYTHDCQHPRCQLKRGIAKNEPILKMKPSALFGAMCSLATFGRMTMVEACTREDSNLGQVCYERGYHFERLGLFNDYEISKPQGYHKAKFLLNEKSLKILVSTPPCGQWSIMQKINQRNEQQKENLRKKRVKSHRIFENNKRLTEHQVLNLHGSALAEQPHNSRSWQKTCWRELHKILPYEVIVDGCACGLRAPDTGELMKKRWKLLTNDKRIWVALQPLQCRGDHYHEEIESSLRIEAYGAYPKMLCRRILRALTKSQNTNYFEDEDGEESHLTKDTIQKLESYVSTNVMALAILDAGSDMLYVRLIDEKKIPGQTRQVRARDLRQIFTTRGFPWIGRPKIMRYDPAGSATSDEFKEWVESLGIYCLPCAADAHRQIGKIERAIEAFKEALDAFDEMVSAEMPTTEMIGLQVAARNDLIRIDGFTALQRYAGRTPTGTTVNPSDEPRDLPLISAELEDGAFSRDAQVRRLSRLAHIQTSDRVKRAEAARFRSFNEYETGDLVFVYRRLPPGAWRMRRKGDPWLDATADPDPAIQMLHQAYSSLAVNLPNYLTETPNHQLRRANFYGDHAYSVQQHNEAKEDDELIMLEIPIINELALMAYMDDPSNYVASQTRKGRVEVSFKKATPDEKKLLLEAQQKECSSALSTKAVRILSKQGVDPARLLRCRFVLTWKKGEQGNVLRGKARLVVLGFRDPDLLHLRTESPVASRRARQLLLAMAARHKWKLEKAVAVTALLQGETDEEKRKIYADPPKDVRPAFGMRDDQDTLKKLELEVVQCEPCVWVIRDGLKLVGMVILHVDDMMIAGDHTSLAFLKKRTDI
ncbi:unnamed protein product [Prorocentrum cordatum]|uniref:Integrase catalytic domain-containing protein n=1 Tax=Prorocentrum cordatum TaxID=2364126 RepID=A0ABN9PJW5_9DINO|nr:unnamed protein product [Polarella glacialis]